MRALIFWGVCVPTRLYLASLESTPILRGAAIVISSRWLLGYENGNEGFFGGPVWWADERPLHGAFWLGYALTGNNRFLLADVGIGVANWLINSNK